MSKISFIVVFLFFAISYSGVVYGQNYSSDAQLLKLDANIATIKCTGIAKKKKDAAEMAAKSALYTYLISGIDGLNDNQPIIKDPSRSDIENYMDRLFNGGRYSVFVQNIIVDKDASRKTPSGHMASVMVSMHIDALYKDMVRSKILSKTIDKVAIIETQEQLNLPSIMVIPYCATNQSFLDAIQQNPDIRMAMARVTEGFIKKGVETKDFEQSLRNAEEYQARQGDLSLDDAILNAAGADVAVQVDITKDNAYDGLRISMRLTAIDVSTGNTLASKSETSARKKTSANIICTALAEHMLDDFLTQISTRMANRIAKGNTIAINITIDPNSMVNMDTEMGNTYLPMSDAIVLWVRDNAKNGKYHQKGRSATMLALDKINIKNKDTNGVDLNINDFSLNLYRYLRGLGVSVKRNIVGNTLHITIM